MIKITSHQSQQEYQIITENKDGNAILSFIEQENTISSPISFDWDLQKISENKYHIIYENESFSTEIIKIDEQEKIFTVKINGKTVALKAKDRFDLLLEKMGLSNLSKPKINQIKAPMPGLIRQIKVEIGQNVLKGDQLFILEAMKMENVLKSPTDGVIKAIRVKVGDTVDKNQLLVEFE